MSIDGSSFSEMAGEMRRFGPAIEKGEALFEKTGSVKIVSPPLFRR